MRNTRQGMWLTPVLLLFAGCMGQNNLESDPLFNGPPVSKLPAPPKQPVAAAAAPADPLTSGATTPLPPLPAPHSTTSQAALAAGVYQPLGNGRDLRAGTPVPGNSPTAQLRQPEPLPDAEPQARTNAVPAAHPGVVPAGGGLDSYQQAQDLLAQRGVNWQRLETVGTRGEWKFSCSIPNRQNPSINRNYESAPSPTALAAIQAVLDQIDREQR